MTSPSFPGEQPGVDTPPPGEPRREATVRPPVEAPAGGAPGVSPQPTRPYGASPVGGPAGHAGGPVGYGTPYAFDPEAPYGRSPSGVPYSDKSKVVAGLLQIFVGGLGVGRFYLGYPRRGAAQLGLVVGGWAIAAIASFLPLLFIGDPDAVGLFTVSTLVSFGVSCVALAALIGGAVWGFVDGVLMLTNKVPDPQGRPLRP